MSKLDDIATAIENAIDEEPMSEVLSAVTGCFVGLLEGLAKQKGFNPDESITVAGGPHRRDITLHATKPQAQA